MQLRWIWRSGYNRSYSQRAALATLWQELNITVLARTPPAVILTKEGSPGDGPHSLTGNPEGIDGPHPLNYCAIVYERERPIDAFGIACEAGLSREPTKATHEANLARHA